MTLDERLEAIARNLDTLTKIHLDNDREYRERFSQSEREYRERFSQLGATFEKLHAAFEKLHGAVERLHAAVERLEIVARQDGENIRALARIAEIHERRLTELEGGDQPA